MEDVDITSGSNAGALAGSNSGNIHNAYSTGTVSGIGNIGGVVGVNTGEGAVLLLRLMDK